MMFEFLICPKHAIHQNIVIGTKMLHFFQTHIFMFKKIRVNSQSENSAVNICICLKLICTERERICTWNSIFPARFACKHDLIYYWTYYKWIKIQWKRYVICIPKYLYSRKKVNPYSTKKKKRKRNEEISIQMK